MTAEIAIMNKTGVALAADSAVTIGGTKIYNSANKLFTLSKIHPVGIMVYGSAGFMEVPWENIIKSYRKKLNSKHFDTLKEYQEDFLNYIINDERYGLEEIEELVVSKSFSDYIKQILKMVEDDINKARHNQEDISDERVTDWLLNHIKQHTENLRQKSKKLLTFSYDEFNNKFSHTIKEVTEYLIIYDVPEFLEEELYKLAYELIRSDFFSSGSTGVVISGYGEEDIFPGLIEVKVEGFVFRELKYDIIKEQAINHLSGQGVGHASIVPFAQKEMVASFMRGVDPTIEDAFYDIIHELLISYPERLKEDIGVELTEDQVIKMEEMGNELYNKIEQIIGQFQRKKFVSPIIQIVRSLPKEELADMAEALVNLTSFKRRVSRDNETVGGPIDVAVITKGDGFIWIKRKHYFDPNLNYQFLQSYLRGVNNNDDTFE